MDPNDILAEMAPAATSGAWMVDFLLWLSALAGLIVFLFACRAALRQINMSGQRDFGQAGRMFLASLVLGAPLLFADVVKRAVFGAASDGHDPPQGVDFLDAPFNAPPPQRR